MDMTFSELIVVLPKTMSMRRQIMEIQLNGGMMRGGAGGESK